MRKITLFLICALLAPLTSAQALLQQSFEINPEVSFFTVTNDGSYGGGVYDGYLLLTQFGVAGPGGSTTITANNGLPDLNHVYALAYAGPNLITPFAQSVNGTDNPVAFSGQSTTVNDPHPSTIFAFLGAGEYPTFGFSIPPGGHASSYLPLWSTPPG